MKRRTLRRKVRKEARRSRRSGEISREEYKAALAVAKSDEALDALQREIDYAKLDPYENPSQLWGMDWTEILANLMNWFTENWPQILEFIMTILPLLSEPKHAD
jgi:hypothetical protein